MSKPFDMELFLAGVLGDRTPPRQRHLRHAKAIQTAIAERWQLNATLRSKADNHASPQAARR